MEEVCIWDKVLKNRPSNNYEKQLSLSSLSFTICIWSILEWFISYWSHHKQKYALINSINMSGVLTANRSHHQQHYALLNGINIYLSAGIYPLKVNKRDTRTRCEICSKLTTKIAERHQWLWTCNCRLGCIRHFDF